MGNTAAVDNDVVDKEVSKRVEQKPFFELNLCKSYLNHFERHEFDRFIPNIIIDLIVVYYPDRQWQQCKCGDLVDAKTQWNRWYPARIVSRDWQTVTLQFLGFEDKWNKSVNLRYRERFIASINAYGSAYVCDCMHLCTDPRHIIAPYQSQSVWHRYQQNIRTYDYEQDYNLNSVYRLDHAQYVSLVANVCDNAYYKTKSDEGRHLSNISSILQCMSQTPEILKLSSCIKPNAICQELGNLLREYQSNKYRVMSIRPLVEVLGTYNVHYWHNKSFVLLMFSSLYSSLSKFDLVRELFELELTYNVICNVCSNAHQLKMEKYAGLELPINAIQSYEDNFMSHNSNVASYVIDIHRLDQKPIRHLFSKLNKRLKIKVIAEQIKQLYDTDDNYLLFYDVFNHQILTGYPQKRQLKTLPDLDSYSNTQDKNGMKTESNHRITCFVVKNWKKNVKEQYELLREYNIEPVMSLLNLTHVNTKSKKLFGFPSMLCYLTTHTQRQIHQIIYDKLYTLCEQNSDLFPIKSPGFVNSFTAQFKRHEAKQNDETEDMENEWEVIFEKEENLPYRLVLLPQKMEISYDSQIFDELCVVTKPGLNTNIMVQWKPRALSIVENIFGNSGNIEMTENYLRHMVEQDRRMKLMHASKQDVTLHDCLNDWLVEKNSWQNLAYWYCPHCKNNRSVMQSRLDVAIEHLPQILICTLQRFGVVRNYNKINKVIHFDLKGFDLSAFTDDKEKKVTESTQSKYCYDLYAVICHENNGEYFYNYILDEKTDEWYLCNYHGDVIKTNTLDFYSSSSAYILFYRRRENAKHQRSETCLSSL